MSIQLTLLPFDQEDEDFAFAFSHTVLPCDDGIDVDSILKLESELGQHVPSRFNTYISREAIKDKTGYGNTQLTPYGERINTLTVEQLRTVGGYSGPIDAFLRACKPTRKVALFWK